MGGMRRQRWQWLAAGAEEKGTREGDREEAINGNNGRERQECVAEVVSKARYPCNPNLCAGLGRGELGAGACWTPYRTY